MEKVVGIKKNIILIFVGILLFCLSIYGWLYFKDIKGCFLFTCPPVRNFDVLNVGIPNSYYPSGVERTQLHEFEIEGDFSYASNAGSQGYSIMSVVYNITHYKQGKFAEKDFNTEKKGSNIHFLEIDQSNEYLPVYATEYYYQCGEYNSNGYMCKFIGRYEEFVITYFTSTEAGAEQVDYVVQYLDERMGKLLAGIEVEDWREVKGPYWEEWEEAEK